MMGSMARSPVLEQAALVEPSHPQVAMTPQPIGEKERIFSIDVLRGLAVLCILPMNIQSFSMVREAYWNPSLHGALKGANYWIWFLSSLLTDQKFMTVFSLLFGAGILMMCSHIEAAGKRSATLHYRRMGWLVLIGLVHSYLLWSGDVLVAYGLCGALVYVCRRLRPSTLLLLAFASIALGTVSLIGYCTFIPMQGLISRACAWIPQPLSSQAEIAAYRGSWMAQMAPRIETSLQVEILSFTVLTFWRVTGLMLAGMAFLKLGVLDSSRPARAYWQMIAAAICIGLPISLYGIYHNFSSNVDSLYSFVVAVQFNYWASLVVTLGWIGAIMLASKRAILLPVTRRLAAVGRVALTNYLMQTIICTTIFYGHGFGLFEKVDRVGQFAVVLAIWALQLAISPIWLKRFLFGPMEWLWRCLTYMQREPFLRIDASR
jgi:uncharacterized protein